MTEIRQNAPRRVDRLQHVNDPTAEAFKNPLMLQYMRVLVDAIRRIEEDMIARNTATPEVLLMSPGGIVYAIRVDDAGVLYSVRARG